MIALIYSLALGGFFYAMKQPPQVFSRVMMRVGPAPFLLFPFENMWKVARAGSLQPGSPAPEFRLPLLDGSGSVELSSIRADRPVVLIFGSYTWPPFRREVPALNKLYDLYKSQAAFYVVYIAEAHPSDIWQMQSNIKDRVIFRDPTTTEERQDVANSCIRKLHIKIPALIDGIDNQVERQYTAWPDRLFLVGRDGKVRYKSEAGPFGFDPKKLESALRKDLGR